MKYQVFGWFITVHDNDVDSYVPEVWANEGLMVLYENMVMANLVHRDFSNEIAEAGDIVNTRRPSTFVGARKTANDDVAVQALTATNVPVALDQYFHTSFIIRDAEASKSFKDLVNDHLRPAAMSIASAIDHVLLGQVVQYIAKRAGTLGTLTSSNTIARITSLKQAQTEAKVPETDRRLILTPSSEAAFLQTEMFTSAEKVGDAGTALRTASLGQKFGYNIFTCQNTPQPTQADSDIDQTMLVNLTAGYVAGDTVLVVDGITGEVVTGEWVSIVGSEIPHQITAHTETATNTTEITISPALVGTVANNAIITRYMMGEVNLAAGYAAGYAKTIVYDGFTKDPQVGQFCTFEAVTTKYVIIQVDTTAKTILLDRPLVAAIANNDNINLGPGGSYNFAFHRNALSLVNRPLALPDSRLGVRAAVVNMGGIAIRVTITYDGTKQGVLVTLDTLCGVKVLDTNLGAVLLG